MPSRAVATRRGATDCTWMPSWPTARPAPSRSVGRCTSGVTSSPPADADGSASSAGRRRGAATIATTAEAAPADATARGADHPATRVPSSTAVRVAVLASRAAVYRHSRPHMSQATAERRLTVMPRVHPATPTANSSSPEAAPATTSATAPRVRPRIVHRSAHR
ncbi:hypothetical protein SZ60_04485 [Frigoribacterium sp. MEB024]|nr:hypothetical protein SZ60_04485 [Frigoribacterium sp. MEB024]